MSPSDLGFVTGSLSMDVDCCLDVSSLRGMNGVALTLKFVVSCSFLRLEFIALNLSVAVLLGPDTLTALRTLTLVCSNFFIQLELFLAFP